MKNKAEKLRDLLGHAINVLDKQCNIESITKPIILETEVCGKRSIIICNPLQFDELHITIWWGYKLDTIPEEPRCSEPLSTLPKNKIHDARVGGWIERKDGFWIQGGSSRSLSPKYCSVLAEKDLEKIPMFTSHRIQRTGVAYDINE